MRSNGLTVVLVESRDREWVNGDFKEAETIEIRHKCHKDMFCKVYYFTQELRS